MFESNLKIPYRSKNIQKNIATWPTSKSDQSRTKDIVPTVFLDLTLIQPNPACDQIYAQAMPTPR
jgi:hypothetical protein